MNKQKNPLKQTKISNLLLKRETLAIQIRQNPTVYNSLSKNFKGLHNTIFIKVLTAGSLKPMGEGEEPQIPKCRL